MNAADELNAIYARRLALEDERAAAAAAERDRVSRETENKRKLDAQARELTALDAQARRAELTLAVEHAQRAHAHTLATADELRTAADEVLTAIVAWLDTAAAASERAYTDERAAIDRALAAAAAAYEGETRWPTGEDYAALDARQKWNAGRVAALGSAGQRLAVPLPAWAIVGELAAHATDEKRRRAAHALYAALMGEFTVRFTGEYSADTVAQRQENDRRARYVRGKG